MRVPAKVNLHLSVGDRRADGYHELSTVFQAVDLYDEVTVRPAARLSVEVSGEGADDVPRGPANLAAKAARLVARTAGVPARVRISIRKSIPVAGGMAGGSADAAAALIACDALWGAGLDRSTLAGLAAALGSDVPFALHGGTALGSGRGEHLSPVLAPGRQHWVLALAAGGLPTATVYEELDRGRSQLRPGPVAAGAPEELLVALRGGDPAAVGRMLANDLQEPALRLRPQLRRVFEAAHELGVAGAVLCGSGPTVALLAASAAEAVEAAAVLSGLDVCRAVRVASGSVPGARVLADPS